MPKYKFVNVTVTAPDGEVLEYFQVCHYKSEDSGSFSDEENVGSHASGSLLVDRIGQYVEGA